MLTAREILEESVQLDLLVLSACETGVAESLGGQELAGLSQAFLHAGARCLVASLWKVDDPATSTLMTSFYGNWRSGADLAGALSEATAAGRGESGERTPIRGTLSCCRETGRPRGRRHNPPVRSSAMWLRVPDAIEQTVWEGELQPDDDDDVRRDSSSPGQPRDIRDLPVVSIGRPEVWTLAEFYGTEDLPAPVLAKLGDASFYLVRLSCSFRPTKNKTRVEWARLTISLHPDAAGQVGTAFDLHPLRVTQEVKRSVNVSLSPTLKFQEVQASIGGAASVWSIRSSSRPSVRPVPANPSRRGTSARRRANAWRAASGCTCS